MAPKLKKGHQFKKNQPGTEKHHKNPPETMTNHKNQPGPMQNHNKINLEP